MWERERDIESAFVRMVSKEGGRAYKFTSPGCAGVPDRLVLLPGGITAFVELKAPGQRPRPIQEKRGKEIAALGIPVYWIDSKEAARDFVSKAAKGELVAKWGKWRG